MKKALSLALALAMCLGLTVPAFAAEVKAGDTTITDANGVTYQLSNPIIKVGEQVTANYVYYIGDEKEEGSVVLEKAYIVPVGTKITILEAKGYQMTEDEYGDTVFTNPNNQNDTIRCMIGVHMGMGGFNKEGFTVGSGDYYGISSYHWQVKEGIISNQTEAYYFVADTPVTPTEPENPTYQVSNWAKDRVAVAVEAGLAADSLGNDYRVNITRAQFAATAVKLYEAMSGKKVDAVTENPFNDTTDPVILQAASMGFVSGVGDGKFSPDALVTREQAAVMLSSVFTKLGGEVPAVEATSFADNGSVSGWARNAVAFMNSREIITGVGNNSFAPKDSASIEQALLIALKMFENLK